MIPVRLILIRTFWNDKYTLGELQLWNGSSMVYSCKTLERPWVNNERNKSCAPAGEYKLVYERSPKFKRNLFELKGVPGRSEIKIHVANFVYQLQGCIGVGHYIDDLNSDGIMDIGNSAKTLDILHKKILPTTELTLTIINPVTN